jgi:hypothetical protein
MPLRQRELPGHDAVAEALKKRLRAAGCGIYWIRGVPGRGTGGRLGAGQWAVTRRQPGARRRCGRCRREQVAPDRHFTETVMKRITLLAASLTLLTGGCATHPVATSSSFYNDIDTDKVASINKVASERGVEVHWVNYPQRKQSVVPAGS